MGIGMMVREVRVMDCRGVPLTDCLICKLAQGKEREKKGKEKERKGKGRKGKEIAICGTVKYTHI